MLHLWWIVTCFRMSPIPEFSHRSTCLCTPPRVVESGPVVSPVSGTCLPELCSLFNTSLVEIHFLQSSQTTTTASSFRIQPKVHQRDYDHGPKRVSDGGHTGKPSKGLHWPVGQIFTNQLRKEISLGKLDTLHKSSPDS